MKVASTSLMRPNREADHSLLSRAFMVYTVTTLLLACDISHISHEGAMEFYTQKRRTRWSSLLVIYLHSLQFWGGGGLTLFSFIRMFTSSHICVCPSTQLVLSILGAVLGKFEEFAIQRTVHRDIFVQ